MHFGVDIGGTGIKAAPVDLTTGQLIEERVRLLTPHPATPDAVADVVAETVSHFTWAGPIGVAFPAAVKAGTAVTAANVDKSWIGTNIEEILQTATGSPVTAVNDADAAGVAEMAYGAGRDQHGVVIMTTFGTGIGTAVFQHGQLLPNTELGHLEIDGKDAETRASELIRERKGLSWKKWAKRVDRYLNHLEALFWPDMIIIGGGASRKADKFLSLLTVKTAVLPAALQNDAGIVGAAVAARADVTRSDTRSVADLVAEVKADKEAATSPSRKAATRATSVRVAADTRASSLTADTAFPSGDAPAKIDPAAAAPNRSAPVARKTGPEARKAAAKRTATKTATKTATQRATKSATPAAKKSAAKKSTAAQAAPRKRAAQKAVTQKAVTQKAVTQKAVTKKAVTKKAPAKKTAAKRAPAKRRAT